MSLLLEGFRYVREGFASVEHGKVSRQQKTAPGRGGARQDRQGWQFEQRRSPQGVRSRRGLGKGIAGHEKCDRGGRLAYDIFKLTDRLRPLGRTGGR